MEKAISIATDEQNEATKKAKAETRERAMQAVAFVAEMYGLEATWVRSQMDTDYTLKYQQYGGRRWEALKVFRHRVKVDDVMLGLKYDGRYGGDAKPSIDVMYVTCPSCGDEHAVDMGYVTTHGGVERCQSDLISKIGRIATKATTCGKCQAQPCCECGRPF
jgi:hypothetical protein